MTNDQHKPRFGSTIPSPPSDSHRVAQNTLPSRRSAESSVGAVARAGMRKSSEASGTNLCQSHSMSSCASAVSCKKFEHRHDHGEVRTLPAWIGSFERCEDDVLSGPTDKLLSPPQAHPAQHNCVPSKPERRVSQDGFVDTEADSPNGARAKATERGLFCAREPDRGRKWDHVREGEPVIMQSGVQKTSQWKIFVRSSAYRPAPEEARERVDEAFLESQTPGLHKPWRGDMEGGDPEKAAGLLRSKKKRRVWYQRIQNVILLHPLVPLALRLTILATSVIALGLSGSIYYMTSLTSFHQNPSTVMAIGVDVIALPYIGYVTWDEYAGKPLGLRSPKAKMTLVLLDLFFIMFESANLALAFAEKSDSTGVCALGENGSDRGICERVKTLCTFLFVALVAWSLTFSVSIFRVVERVGGREEPD